MSFLQPIAWSALALAIPIVAFYLLKTRLRRRLVSTSLFWHQLAPQVYNTSLWRKLRRWLSLLLQLLFLTALVMALAQPIAAWQSLQPASLVLVLDPSVTMEATDVAPSRWQHALQLAAQRIDQMRGVDEATLILAADPPQVLTSWASSKRLLHRALAQAQLSGHSTDVRPALALARNLAQGRPHGHILLLSDGVWPEPPKKEQLAGIEAPWISGDGVNTGLTLFAVRRAFSGPGEFQLAARVEAHGPSPVSGNLEIYRDGRLMDVQALELTPGQPWDRTWDGRAGQTTRFEAKLAGFPPDRLTRDDHAEAVLPAQTPVKVELVAPANGFLDAALSSLDSVAWKRTWPAQQLGPAQPGMLYVFYRCLPPPDFAAATVLIDPAASGPWGELRGPIDQPLISDFQHDSELLRHTGIEKIGLQKAREFIPAPGAEVLAESFGKPIIFGQWHGDRRWLALTFDLESSDFVLRTAFPILLGNIIESLRREADVAPPAPLPGPIASALKRTVPDNAPVSITSRDAASVAWWSGYPLWWWAVSFGACWLLAEWWSYSRRITE
ncbi:MAG TPA: VWA domain-containing protein [Chthoniobacter sp.]|jgi:hypothetical protein